MFHNIIFWELQERHFKQRQDLLGRLTQSSRGRILLEGYFPWDFGVCLKSGWMRDYLSKNFQEESYGGRNRYESHHIHNWDAWDTWSNKQHEDHEVIQLNQYEQTLVYSSKKLPGEVSLLLYLEKWLVSLALPMFTGLKPWLPSLWITRWIIMRPDKAPAQVFCFPAWMRSFSQTSSLLALGSGLSYKSMSSREKVRWEENLWDSYFQRACHWCSWEDFRQWE